MRRLVDAGRISEFMRALGRVARREQLIYLTGGATAVLYGWRASTIDIDIALATEDDELLRALPRIKDELAVNVELASPADFVPVPVGWEERSISIGREGVVTFLHFDPYSQALSKLERAHPHDLEDVRSLLAARLVDPARLRAAFDEIEPHLYRYPAVDPAAFRRRVDGLLRAI